MLRRPQRYFRDVYLVYLTIGACGGQEKAGTNPELAPSNSSSSVLPAKASSSLGAASVPIPAANSGGPGPGQSATGLAQPTPSSVALPSATSPAVNPSPSSGTSTSSPPSSNAAGTGEVKAPLALTELKVEANTKMSLGCYVNWTTSEPASSEVEFGVDGYQLRISDATETTQHRVYVVGMHAETKYKLRALSNTKAAKGTAEAEFTTGKLPKSLPSKATLVTNNTKAMQPGWTLTNYHVGNSSSSSSTEPGIIVMLDEGGIPVWYYVHGTKADQFGMTSTAWLTNGHVLVGNAEPEPAQEVDLEGNVIWSGPTGGSPNMSHHTSKTASGNYLVVRESNTSARVEELDPTKNNQVVWSWDLYDYLKPKSTAADWCHLNSVSMDEANGILYFNCRWQGLFKVKHGEKSAPIWQLGAAADDSKSGTITYLPDNTARFNDAHDPEVHSDGTVLFYDNQGWTSHTTGEANGSHHTRVVEYQLDEAKKEAKLVWEFPGSFNVDAWYKEKWSTPIWGDANRLANGNVLITAGIRGAGTHTRIFEVTRAGEVVWAVEWPENNGSYRATRVSPAPAQSVVP